MITRIKLGAGLWLLSLQYYVVQVVVAAHWQGRGSFSWLQNTISDLGNTACADYGQRYVCSPQHGLMNASFIVLGLTMIAGALLLIKLGTNRLARFGFSCMVLAGIGSILVGLFPENSVSQLHILGAALPFVLGNIGIIALSLTLELTRWLKLCGIALGVVALLALPLFMSGQTLGIGSGGVERITAYPQSIWMILVGAYGLSSARFGHRGSPERLPAQPGA